MKRCTIGLCLSLAIVSESKAQKLVSPTPELRPNAPHRLVEQNLIALSAGFRPIESLTMLNKLRREGVLVEIPRRGKCYYLELGLSHAFAAPEVHDVLTALDSLCAASSPSRSFKITSLTRTRLDHRRLQRRVPSAASCVTPEQCSPHLYGLAFDISKRPMNVEAVRWLRRALVLLQCRGRLHAWEEMYGNNFHVMAIPPFIPTRVSGL